MTPPSTVVPTGLREQLQRVRGRPNPERAGAPEVTGAPSEGSRNGKTASHNPSSGPSQPSDYDELIKRFEADIAKTIADLPPDGAPGCEEDFLDQARKMGVQEGDAFRIIKNAQPGPSLRRSSSPSSLAALPAKDRFPNKTWPVLGEAALYGLAGDIVRAIAPETEADPAALLVSLLVAVGSCVGPSPHVRADGAAHTARLFAVVVGQTAKSRKGTSWNRIREFMDYVDPEWTKKRNTSGLSSGEGLIKHAVDGRDHRLFVQEPEFARTLAVASRDGNTLSAVLRQAWDTGDLRAMTKEPISVEDAHISILAHVTEEELVLSLNGIQAANGFGNRFLFVCAKRAQLLPSGGKVAPETVADLGERLRSVVSTVSTCGELHRSTRADQLWDRRYREMATDDPGGLLGGIVSRSESQVLRLSLIYALMDRSHVIEPVHIEAAWAAWSYCRQSAEWLFGGRTGTKDGDRIVDALKSLGGHASRTALMEAMGGRPWGDALDKELDRLVGQGRVARTTVPTGGRPGEQIALLEGGR